MARHDARYNFSKSRDITRRYSRYARSFKGILTARGGMTSHAAVVARGMGRPCVSGSSEIDINYENKSFKTSSH